MFKGVLYFEEIPAMKDGMKTGITERPGGVLESFRDPEDFERSWIRKTGGFPLNIVPLIKFFPYHVEFFTNKRDITRHGGDILHP
jgi:hypothetical protein